MRYATQHAHYLTVSESRRWSMDHPVGNPHHDFKTKEMPVVAVAAIAYGAFSMAGAVVMSSAWIAGGLMMASGALSLAGQITGNKTLSMVGAVVGVAAAGVGLWNSMGSAVSTGADLGGVDPSAIVATEGGGLANSAATGAVAGTEAAASTAGNASSLTLDVLDSGSLVSQSSSGVGGGLAEQLAAQPGYAAPGQMVAPSAELAGTASTAASPAPSLADQIAAQSGSAAPAVQQGAGVDGATINQGGIGPSSTEKFIDAGGLGGAPKAEPGMLDSVMNKAGDFGKAMFDPKSTNQLPSKIMDLGGSVMKSYGEKDLVAAQEDLAKAQASGVQANVDLAQYNLELAKKRYANMNTRATSAAAQTGAVNQNANIYSNPAQPAQGGLIFSGAK